MRWWFIFSFLHTMKVHHKILLTTTTKTKLTLFSFVRSDPISASKNRTKNERRQNTYYQQHMTPCTSPQSALQIPVFGYKFARNGGGRRGGQGGGGRGEYRRKPYRLHFRGSCRTPDTLFRSTNSRLFRGRCRTPETLFRSTNFTTFSFEKPSKREKTEKKKERKNYTSCRDGRSRPLLNKKLTTQNEENKERVEKKKQTTIWCLPTKKATNYKKRKNEYLTNNSKKQKTPNTMEL